MYSDKITEEILRVTSSDSIKSVEHVQALWSNYGSLDRVHLNGTDLNSIIVKQIDLTNKPSHPRGWNTDKSHLRKLESYNVEVNFYKNYNFLRSIDSYFPKCFYSNFEEESIVLIMEDLQGIGYSKTLKTANDKEIKLCLKWLAEFHSRGFLNQNNDGLWSIGTYWHLGTREQEFSGMKDSDLKKYAKAIDKNLNDAKFKTIIHGDAKIANFCFTENSNSVAGVDFQYVGYGSPAKDLTYFLGSVLDNDGLETNFYSYKSYYYNALEHSIKRQKLDLNFINIKKELEELVPYAIADFERFLQGWMPTHHKITQFSKNITSEVINSLRK